METLIAHFTAFAAEWKSFAMVLLAFGGIKGGGDYFWSRWPEKSIRSAPALLRLCTVLAFVGFATGVLYSFGGWQLGALFAYALAVDVAYAIAARRHDAQHWRVWQWPLIRVVMACTLLVSAMVTLAALLLQVVTATQARGILGLQLAMMFVVFAIMWLRRLRALPTHHEQ